MSHFADNLRTRFSGELYKVSAKLVHYTEALAVVYSYIIAIWGVSTIYNNHNFNWNYIVFGILVFLSRLALSQLTTLANLPRTLGYRMLLFRFLQVSSIEFIICSLIWIIAGFSDGLPYLVIPLYCLISLSLTFTFRILSYKVLKHYRVRGYNNRYLIVIADAFSDGIIEQLIKQNEWGFQVKFILSNSRLIHAKYGERIKVYRENADLRFLLDCHVIDEVVFCKKKFENDQVKKVLKICDEVGVLFRMQFNFSPLKPVKLRLQIVNLSPYFQLLEAPARSFYMMVKNVADIYISASALLLLLPFLLIIASIVKFGSKGPVLFIQERIGLRGRKFNLYKFRTMVQDAESLKEKLEEYNEADGPVFKIKSDPRITNVGRFLRKTGLDELPQLINVVKGEMSLIGPRPPVAKEVIQYKRWQLRRLSVKPGITCTWQVLENRNEVSFDKWMQLDLQYIDNWTLQDDIKLFFRTVNTLIRATGS